MFATSGGLCDRLASRLCGLATCFGASMVTPGSWLCDIAVPLRPQNNAVDRMVTAGATRLDDILMMRTPIPNTKAGPVRTPYRIQPAFRSVGIMSPDIFEIEARCPMYLLDFRGQFLKP